MFKILVVDDDPGLRLSVKSTLLSDGRFEVDEAFDGLNAVEKVKENTYNMVLLDVDMPRMTGLEAMREIKKHDPSIITLILTAFANIDDAVRAVKEGAYNYVSKPIKGDDLVRLIDQSIQAANLISDVAASAPILMEANRKMIGHTAQMKKVFHVITRLSKVDTPVLIRGASGTGKELVARAIHSNSPRKEGKFVAINCAAIPENLFESELFGHEKGAFTGADQRKIGSFQYAEGGTLFLDEVGDMPPLMQVKLLRVLQEKVFSPVGSNREIETDVRIIAATNRPLEDMFTKGEFREDLYYRLNVMPILLPELKERIDDLDQIVNQFIKKFNRIHGREIVGISKDAMECLKKYDWPGNIRELENVIEHCFILEEAKMIRITSLPENILNAAGVELSAANYQMPSESELAKTQAPTTIPASSQDDELEDITGDDGVSFSFDGNNLDFNRQKEQFEKEFIVKALKTFKGRINQTALHANIPKKTLLRKIEKYGINARDYVES